MLPPCKSLWQNTTGELTCSTHFLTQLISSTKLISKSLEAQLRSRMSSMLSKDTPVKLSFHLKDNGKMMMHSVWKSLKIVSFDFPSQNYFKYFNFRFKITLIFGAKIQINVARFACNALKCDIFDWFSNSMKVFWRKWLMSPTFRGFWRSNVHPYWWERSICGFEPFFVKWHG